jgi:hypothetical protein
MKVAEKDINILRSDCQQLVKGFHASQDPRVAWLLDGHDRSIEYTYQVFYRKLLQLAHENKWRVPFWIDQEDLFQEGFMVWLKICQRYQTALTRPHLIRLFLTSVKNHFHNIVNKHRKEKETCIFPVDKFYAMNYSGIDHKELFFRAALSRASPEAKEVMQAFIFPTFSPRKIMNRRKRAARNKIVSRETTNQRFGRLLKKKYTTDLASEIKELLA